MYYFSCSLIWNQQFIYEVLISLKLFLFIKPWLAIVTQITVLLPLKQPMTAISTSSHRFNFFRAWTWLKHFLTFCHRSFTINSNKSPTWCNNFSVILMFVYNSTCSGCFPAHHQELNDCSGSLWFYLPIVVTVVLCSWSGRPAGRPDHEHSAAITTIWR
jgi:hypothetical protein